MSVTEQADFFRPSFIAFLPAGGGVEQMSASFHLRMRRDIPEKFTNYLFYEQALLIQGVH